MPQQVELACLAADHGAFDSAVALCRTVPATHREFAACQSLVASVYRQVGRHAVARRFDEGGLRARPTDALGAAMCSLGLAADAVGMAADAGDVAAALGRAADAVAQVPADHWATRWFDPWVTLAWVEAEVALLRDDPQRAVAVLEPFANLLNCGTPHTRWRHERAKSWLFLGVAQRCAGQDGAALESISQAVGIAAQAGLRPLLVPAVEQLQVLDATASGPWAERAEMARRYLDRHRPPIL